MADDFVLPEDMHFWQFWWQATRHSFTKAWIGVLAMSGILAIGVPLARLLYNTVAYQTFFDILENYWTGWILMLAFFIILLGRCAYAPFLIYKQIECQKSKLRSALEDKIGRDQLLDELSAKLNVVQKMKRVCNDPHQDAPAANVADWEIATCIFLREQIGKWAEDLFTSEVGVPEEPLCEWTKDRARLLRLLHYRSYQLREIFFMRLSQSTPDREALPR